MVNALTMVSVLKPNTMGLMLCPKNPTPLKYFLKVPLLVAMANPVPMALLFEVTPSKDPLLYFFIDTLALLLSY